MDDQSLKAEVTEVERELINIIINNLKQGRMTDEQARQWAHEFLALLPIQDKKDLLEKLKQFSRAHVDAKGLFLKYAAPYDEEERQRKLSLMSQHIQNGQIEHALNVAKGESNG